MKEILRINLRRLFQEIPLCRSDVMKPIAAPMVGGMITSSIHVLILVPVFFVLMKERSLRRGTLQPEPVELTEVRGR